MICKQIIFSPTGDTQKVADLLSQPFGIPAQVIDLCNSSEDFSAYHMTSDTLCIIAVPVFAGRVPDIAAERLRKIQGHGATAVLAAVYGNRAFEDALLELQDIVGENGFRCIAGISAVAEHSIARQFGAGRPDLQDAQELKDFAKQILDKLNQTSWDAPQLPGNHPYRPYSPSPMHPQVDTSRCTACNKCAQLCPVQAIPADAPQTTGATCISCMRCISICPQQARFLPQELRSALSQKLAPLCAERHANQLFL